MFTIKILYTNNDSANCQRHQQKTNCMRVDATTSRLHLHYRLDDATRFASHTFKSVNVTDLVPPCIHRELWVVLPFCSAMYYSVMLS